MSTIARSSLRAYVRTKEDVDVNVEEKGEEELDLLSDPLALANTGILLSNKRGDGKVVFNLRELPLHSEWRTSAGHTVSRVSRRDVLICDVTGQPHTIDVPSETLLTILYLPDTVLQAIWLHLVPTEYNRTVPVDIARCRLVCRQWARMLEKMVVYERRLGIKFAPAPPTPARVPSQPPVRVRSIFDSDANFFSNDDDDDDDDGNDYDGPSLDPGRTTFGLLLLLASSRPKPPPARGILKRPGDTKAKGKKSVRWAGLDGDENSDEDDEARELRARESVRRKLAEGGELSRRFLASFFGWSGKHHGHLRGSKRDSDEGEGGDGDESADSDPGDAEDGLGSDPDITAAEEAWYRANVFENQSRNLTRLKELEMRLEEMVRSKTRLRAKRHTKGEQQDGSPLPEGKGKEVASAADETEQDQAKREEDEKREQEPRMVSEATVVVVVDAEGWAASPAYVSPPEALPDEAREGQDGPGGGHQKRRRRDSLTGLLSSVSGARKKLLSR